MCLTTFQKRRPSSFITLISKEAGSYTISLTGLTRTIQGGTPLIKMLRRPRDEHMCIGCFEKCYRDIFKAVGLSLLGKATFANSDYTLNVISYGDGRKYKCSGYFNNGTRGRNGDIKRMSTGSLPFFLAPLRARVLSSLIPHLGACSQAENQQQTQLTYDAESWKRTRATLVGGECSHHCAIPAPLCLHLIISRVTLYKPHI